MRWQPSGKTALARDSPEPNVEIGDASRVEAPLHFSPLRLTDALIELTLTDEPGVMRKTLGPMDQRCSKLRKARRVRRRETAIL